MRIRPDLVKVKRAGLLSNSTENDPPIDSHYNNKELIWFIECVEGNRMGISDGIIISAIMLKVTEINPKRFYQNSWWKEYNQIDLSDSWWKQYNQIDLSVSQQ